ncbi:MAG: alpha/beta fold hydrolase [Anaerolineae bacterium]|nr:alpha/beta fold hydrolase [Anaerolineae bacterium]
MTKSETNKVVLLHGLGRASLSMAYLANRLQRAGYSPCNISYPSHKHPVKKLAINFVLPAIEKCFRYGSEPIHFVTHSLGGIIVRQLAASKANIKIGRVVMLAPPNGGSEVVDTLSDWPFFGAVNGPAGKELGTSENDLPRSLGPAPFEVGIIAGNRTINPLLSLMIDGENDGRMSIENTKLEGMADFLVLPVSHPLIMLDRRVAEQTIHFLEHGLFQKSPSAS